MNNDISNFVIPKNISHKGETIQNQTEPVFSASEDSLEISSQ
jgi:hypothetical protein